MSIPDNYDLWVEHDREQERQLAQLPRCSECRRPIQEDYCYMINDMPICPDCMDRNYRVWTDDLI